MDEVLSEDERRRIEQFAATPRHERNPEQLCPGNGEGED